MSFVGELVASDNTILRKRLKAKRLFLNAGHFNAQSLRPGDVKLSEISQILYGNYLDVVGVSETWLKSYVSNAMVNIPGYRIIRNDRVSIRGGGVALFISTSLKTKVVEKSPPGSLIEYLFVEIKGQNWTALVGAVYRPRGDISDLTDILTDLGSRYTNVIIMGDFNLNLLDNSVLNSCGAFFNVFNMKLVHNGKPTHYDVFHGSTSLIDFFVTNEDLQPVLSDQFAIPSVSKHSLIYHSFNLIPVRTNNVIMYREYKSMNIDNLLCDLSEYDFSSLYNTSNVNTQLNTLNNGVLQMFNKHVPLKQYVIKSEPINYNKWYTPEINNAKTIRDLAFKAYKENPSTSNWAIYCRHRNKVTGLLRKAKRLFADEYFSVSQPHSTLWKKVGRLGVTKNKIQDNATNFSANQLNNAFVHASQPSSSLRNDIYLDESSNSFSFSNVDEAQVLYAILQVKSNAVGVDEIPLKFILLCFPALSQHLTHLCNSIITTSSFPDSWKIAKVLPIPKKSNPENVGDYRPISLLPALSKVWETLIKTQVVDHLDTNNLLYTNQSGFRKFHSTTSAVLDVTENARMMMDAGNITILLLLDFSKAFDSINHTTLCYKLKQQFHFSSSACNLIYSYLTGRTQFVVTNNEVSVLLQLCKGVPQGSGFSAYTLTT